MVRSFIISAAGLGLFGAAAPASADLVTVGFSGVYNLAYFGSQTGAISGHITYDTTQTSHDADGMFSSSVVGFDLNSPILTSLYGVSTVTDSTYAGSSGSVVYKSDYLGSGFDHMAFVFSVAGPHYSNFTIDLNFLGGTFANDSMLPNGVPFYLTADNSNLVLNDSYGDLSFGVLTGMTSVSMPNPDPDPQGGVPEPASWALMLMGFGAVGGAMRRRRTSVRFA